MANKQELESLALNRAKALTMKLVSYRNRNVKVITINMIRKELDEAAHAFLKLHTHVEVKKVEEVLVDKIIDNKTQSSGS